MTRRIAAMLTALLALFALSTEPAGAFGSRYYTAPWGCQAFFQSYGGSTKVAQTVKETGSCASMFARVRYSNGGGGLWVSHPTVATATSSASVVVGGQHKVCSGCTVFST